MAVQWLEKNQTDIKSNQWAETIYGVKATNVFGLAWNYYTAYTKFITGVDVTLDMGIKCEVFMADTYKAGLAATTESWFQKTYFSNTATTICNLYSWLITKREAVVGDDVSVRDSVAELITFRDAIIGIDSIERESFSSVTTGDEVVVAGTLSQTAGSVAVNVAGTHSVLAGEVSLDAPILDLG